MGLVDEIESQKGAITIEWLAAKLTISPKTLCKMVQRGRLPAFRIGGCIRLNPKTVADWLRRRTNV